MEMMEKELEVTLMEEESRPGPLDPSSISRDGDGGSSPPSNKVKTVKLLQCKGCGKMIPMKKKSAILHFKTCQKLNQDHASLSKTTAKTPSPSSSRQSNRRTKSDVKKVIGKVEESKEHYSNTNRVNIKWITEQNTDINQEQNTNMSQPQKNVPLGGNRYRPIPKVKNQKMQTKKKKSKKKQSIKARVLMANAPVPLYGEHGPRPPFAALRCFVCRQRFGQVTKLQSHIYSHLTSKSAKVAAKLAEKLPHPCSWKGCLQAFRTSTYLHHHELSHTPRFCSIRKKAIQRWMGEGIRGKLEFKSRWRISIERKKTFKCPHCPRCFRKFTNFKNHLVVGDGCKMRTISKGRKQRKNRLRRLKAAYLNRHFCTEVGCGKNFPTKLHLKSHTRKEHREDPPLKRRGFCRRKVEEDKKYSRPVCMILCPQCPVDKPSKFRSKIGLSSHVRAMHAEYVCRDCDETICGLQNLVRHRRIHNPVIVSSNPIKEKDKDKEIKQKRNVEVDLVVKKYSSLGGMILCPHCPSKFKAKIGLSNHVRSVHTECVCRDCDSDETFCGLQNLIRHRRTHKPVILSSNPIEVKDKDKKIKRYEKSNNVCPYPGCGVGFIFSKSLNAHLAMHVANLSEPNEDIEQDSNGFDRPRDTDGKSKASCMRTEVKMETDTVESEQNSSGWNLLPQIQHELSFADFDDNNVDECQFQTDCPEMDIKLEEVWNQDANIAGEEFIIGI